MDFGTNQEKDKNVINGLAEMFLNQTQCNFKFEFNDGKSIGANAVILSAGSPVFSEMFQMNFFRQSRGK